MLAEYDMSEYKTAVDVLNAYPGTWIYVREDGKAHNPSNYHDPEISKYCEIKDNTLHFWHSAAAPLDHDWGNLNPRIELVPGIRLPKHQKIRIQYEFLIEKSLKEDAIVFQVMDHTPDGKTLPVFSLHFRDEHLCLRHTTITNKGENGGFHLEPLLPLVFNQWYNIIFEIFLAPTLGTIKVLQYVDSTHQKYLWGTVSATASTFKNPSQLQFGIYGQAGLDEHTQVRYLRYETF